MANLEHPRNRAEAYLYGFTDSGAVVPEPVTRKEAYLKAIKKDFDSIKANNITPEMFGAIGDGINDDTAAIQEAIINAESDHRKIQLESGKTYLITDTLNISSRIMFDGNGATIVSTADDAIHCDGATMWDGEFTVIQNIHIQGKNGIIVETPRTLVLDSWIENTGIAVKVLYGAFESIIENCYFTGNGGTSSGIYCNTSDIYFTNITGYGEHTFIDDYGTSCIYENIHGWPIDSDYDGSIFFYSHSVGFEVTLLNCHSDTYQYAIRSTGGMNHSDMKVYGMICNWSNKPEGWFTYSEMGSPAWAFVKADVKLNTRPTTFHLCNLSGMFCFNNYTFKLSKTDVIVGSNCYCDAAEIVINGTRLDVYLFGSVDTSRRTDLELYIPFCQYFGKPERIAVIENQTGVHHLGKAIGWGDPNGRLKIECSGFTANSGYVQYYIIFSRDLASFTEFTN